MIQVLLRIRGTIRDYGLPGRDLPVNLRTHPKSVLRLSQSHKRDVIGRENSAEGLVSPRRGHLHRVPILWTVRGRGVTGESRGDIPRRLDQTSNEMYTKTTRLFTFLETT